MKCWLNGNFLDIETAQALPIFSEHVEFGGGVFESFRTFPEARVWRLADHWERWRKSALILGYSVPLEWSDFEGIVTKLGQDVSSLSRIKCWTNGEDIWIKSVPLKLTEASLGVIIDDENYQRAEPQVKYGHPFYLEFRNRAKEKQIFETIWFDANENLLEGAITNVFAVIDGQLCTPPADRVLPGLMRRWVIDRYEVVEREIPKTELQQASEIFLTNMVRGVVPVRGWQSWKSGDFEVATRLQAGLIISIKTCQNDVSI